MRPCCSEVLSDNQLLAPSTVALDTRPSSARRLALPSSLTKQRQFFLFVMCVLVRRAVRCIDCNGDSAVDNIIAGLEWVASNFQPPAVASLSLGTSGTNDALDAALLALIDLGVTSVVAAGNFGSGGLHCTNMW